MDHILTWKRKATPQRPLIWFKGTSPSSDNLAKIMKRARSFREFLPASGPDHRAPDEYLALVMRYNTMSWCPPKAAMCNALQPSRFASRISAPNLTSSFTSSKFPSMTDWWSAVCPSGPNELTLNSQLVMFCSSEWSSFVLPFFTASWKTLWGAEHVDISAWLMMLQTSPGFCIFGYICTTFRLTAPKPVVVRH